MPSDTADQKSTIFSMNLVDLLYSRTFSTISALQTKTFVITNVHTFFCCVVNYCRIPLSRLIFPQDLRARHIKALF